MKKQSMSLVMNQEKSLALIKLFAARDTRISIESGVSPKHKPTKPAPEGITYSSDKQYYEDCKTWIEEQSAHYRETTGLYLYFLIERTN